MARCKFTEYVKNELDKFEIKFWLSFETDTKYFLIGFT